MRLCNLFLIIALLPGAGVFAAESPFAKTRAAYEALKSYTDTGTLIAEYGSSTSPTVERHRFTTRLRKPRHYQFDFREDPAAGAERLVIWSDEEAFRSWWSTTGSEGVYPKGRGASAFALTSYPTRGAAMYLAPLLFPAAGLQGPLSVFDEIVTDGTETISGRKCLRLKGVQRLAYQTGHASQPRPMRVWIDASTHLVLKIVEETPRGTLPGTVQRNTVIFDPVADPPLADEQFRFDPPQG